MYGRCWVGCCQWVLLGAAGSSEQRIGTGPPANGRDPPQIVTAVEAVPPPLVVLVPLRPVSTMMMIIASLMVLAALGGAVAPSTCPSGTMRVGAAAGSACISPESGAVVALASPSWVQRIAASTQLAAGCTIAGPAVVQANSSQLVRLERKMVCAASRYHTEPLTVTLTDSWRPSTAVPGGRSAAIEWLTSVASSEGRYWTTSVTIVPYPCRLRCVRTHNQHIPTFLNTLIVVWHAARSVMR